jgi:thioredoxin-related protein
MRFLRHSLSFLVLAAWLAGALAADADKFFDQSLGDFPDELRTVRQAGKQGVLLMFEMEGCPYCRRMREQILSREDVQAYFHRHFAIFTVDTLGSQPVTDFWGGQTTEKGFARALKIHGTPTFIVFGPDGQELVRLAGAAKDAEEFMQFGRYAAEGHYKTQSPEQFYPAAKSWKRP